MTVDGHDQFLSIVRNILQKLEHVDNGSVCLPGVSLNDLAERFTNFVVPSSIAEVMSPHGYLTWLEKEVIDKEFFLNSPHMIGHMTSTMPAYMPALSSVVTAANMNLVKTETGKAATFLEREAIAMIHRETFKCQPAFYEEHVQKRSSCLGVITCGGTTANMQALWMARNRAFPDADKKGLTVAVTESGHKGVVVIASVLAHYSIDKAVVLLGFGRDSLLKMAVDENFMVKTDEIVATVQECRQKNIKVLAIVGVAGATEAGSVDDLSRLATLAASCQAHFHVDAAWGGGLILTDEPWRSKLKGIEEADTVTIDGHKQLYCPLGMGMLLMRDPEAPNRVSASARYIIRPDSFDQGRFTMEGSRPATAVFLHMNLRCLGRCGLGALVRRGCELALYMAKLVEGDSRFELITRAKSSLTNLLLYRYLPKACRGESAAGFHHQLLDDFQIKLQSLQALEGQTFVSRTTVPVAYYGGQWLVCLRVVLGNTAATEESIKAVLEDQARLGQRLEDEARQDHESERIIVSAMECQAEMRI